MINFDALKCELQCEISLRENMEPPHSHTRCRLTLEEAKWIYELVKEAAPDEPRPAADQIKHMVDRFLGWKLPGNFNPDCGISFDKSILNAHTSYPSKYEPVGTNLFDAEQADAMVRHMVKGLPDYKKILIAIIDQFDKCEGTDHTNYPQLTPLDGLTAAEQEALLECQKTVYGK